MKKTTALALLVVATILILVLVPVKVEYEELIKTGQCTEWDDPKVVYMGDPASLSDFDPSICTDNNKNTLPTQYGLYRIRTISIPEAIYLKITEYLYELKGVCEKGRAVGTIP